MATEFLIQNIAELFTVLYSMSGGGSYNNYPKISIKDSALAIFIIFLILILLKGLIVYYTYNYMMPILIKSFSDDNKFTSLSYYESLILVILTSTLFSS